jgi:hypothetical protein
VGGEKHPVSYAENTKRSKKSQALGMTKGRVALPWGGKRLRKKNGFFRDEGRRYKGLKSACENLLFLFRFLHTL